MAKKKQKKLTKRLSNFLGLLLTLAPAVMAAWSAFMSTAVARDTGAVRESNVGGDRPKARKRASRKARA